MKEKVSIFDEESLVEKKIYKKIKEKHLDVILKSNFWDNFWKYFYYFLLILFIIWLLWYFFSKYSSNTINTGNISKSNFFTNTGFVLNKNKGIVSEQFISKYKKDNSIITPIGNINNDNMNYYIVESNTTIDNSIIDNYYYLFPNNPTLNCYESKYSNNWYKKNIGYTEKVNKYINSKKGNKKDISIAVIDSGLFLHKQFNKIIIKNDIKGNIDTLGHGTNVVGIINSINPFAKIIPIKITDKSIINSVDIIKGLKEAIDKKPDIINLSFSGRNKNIFEENLIKEAINKGIIVIAAAGNDGNKVNIYFPASYEDVLTVGSSNPLNLISSFSNFGYGIDLLLPGECIYTTSLNNGFIKVSGTSFSSAMLSGIISLYLQNNINFNSRKDVIKKLISTSNNYNGSIIPNVEKFLLLSNNEISYNLSDYQILNDKFGEFKQLIILENNLLDFINKIDKDNLIDNFIYFKKNIQFLDNNIIKREKIKNNKLREIYNDLNDLFGRKDTFISTDKGLGIELNDKNMSIIIPKNSIFPIRKSKTYLTMNSFQRKMIFKVYQGNNDIASKNEYLGEFIISGLKPIKEIGTRVEIIFDIKKDGKITFTAKDIKYPQNIINGYLDKEAALLKNTDKDINIIKNTFNNILNKNKGLINDIIKEDKVFIRNKYKVIRVVDGDTFKVYMKGKLVSTRMIGIDAPENSKLRKGYIEKYSKESKDFLKDKIEGKNVILEFDETQSKIDKYGRYLIYVFLDGENINNSMILNGYAKEYTFNKKYKYIDLFKKSEEKAKVKKYGIWKK